MLGTDILTSDEPTDHEKSVPSPPMFTLLESASNCQLSGVVIKQVSLSDDEKKFPQSSVANSLVWLEDSTKYVIG